MKPTNTVAKLFSSVSTLAVVTSVFVGGAVQAQTAGQVLVWGYDGGGGSERLIDVPTAANFGVSAIAGGYMQCIALKNSSVMAWGGQNASGENNIPTNALSDVTAIAGGVYCTMALKQNGSVLAWGWNGGGQCFGTDSSGNPINNISNGIGKQYVQIMGQVLTGVNAIASFGWHNIALKDGLVLAWGSNGNSQCNVPIEAKSGVTAIACGSFHSIAIKNGAVLAWGKNSFGQCNVPISAQTGVTAIAGGDQHTAALKNGAVLAWGAGTTNTHDDPEYGQSMVPAAANSGVTAIACGGNHTVALKDGKVLAWGRNTQGECSGTDSNGAAITSQVSSGNFVQLRGVEIAGITAIAASFINTLALKGPPATITGVLPISGPSSGNTNITITGTNFEAPATVTIGGASATNVVVISDTQITATTPAGFPGPAVVAVNLGSSTAFYYRPSCGSDVDNNGVVDTGDLSIVLLDFGSCSESAAVAPQQEPLILQAPEPAKSVPNKK